MPTTPVTEPTTTSPVPGGALPDNASADRTPIAHPSWTDLLVEAERLNRAQLMPHYLCATLLALAEIIHSMSAQAEATGAAALLAGSACAVGGTIGFLLMRRRHEWMQAWALWAGLVSAATALWMVVAVLGGVTWGTLTAALAVDTAAGARWWARHRHGRRPQTPAAPGVDQDEEASPIGEAELARFARLWAENIGSTNGVVPGSVLVPVGAFEHGVEYTVQLVPGKQDLDMVLGALSKIASGLRWTKQQLVVEALPSVDASSNMDSSKLRLRVVLRSPIKQDVYFRGPRYDNGNITLGPYADGVGEAIWRLYGRDSMWGGMVIGGTGSGKSRLLELIGLVALWTGLTYVIHVDGQDGISCPTLWKHAHERYRSDEVDTVLARLDAFKTHRQRNSRTPAPADVGTADYDEDEEEEKGGFTPSPDYPGILVIVDEAHVVITRDNADQWAALAREARKTGIAIIMGDQDGSLETFLKSVLRGSLRAGNAVGLKTDERAQGQIVSNGRFNLTDLPAIPGYGYTLGAEARQAPYRNEFLPSAKNKREMAEAGAPLPDDVLTVGQWYRQARDHRVETLDAATLAAGDAAAALSAASMRDAITSGKTVTRGKTAGRMDLKLIRLQMPVVDVPMPRTAATPAPTAVAPAGETALVCDGLTESARRVLDAVREGNTMPNQIAEVVELTRQQVQTLLRGLIDADLLSKTGNGPAVRYELTEQGMALAVA
ncbi:hypothetical protein [Lentzea sp. CA-135723]|uniref:hypothetical protein n=1 Tax=Lentzea sp. CA-135723 TaxID=3239950 RepID=UPI003D91A080